MVAVCEILMMICDIASVNDTNGSSDDTICKSSKTIISHLGSVWKK